MINWSLIATEVMLMEKTTFYSSKNPYEATACKIIVIPTTVLLMKMLMSMLVNKQYRAQTKSLLRLASDCDNIILVLKTSVIKLSVILETHILK